MNDDHRAQAQLAGLLDEFVELLAGGLHAHAVQVEPRLGLVAALWKELKAVTFDPGFAGSLGLPVPALEVVLTLMIALAVVIGLQMVGVVLMAAMVIAPAVAARWPPLLKKRLGGSETQ